MGDQIRTIQGIVDEAKRGEPLRVAVVAPYDDATVSAIKGMLEEGIGTPVAFGDREKIAGLLRRVGLESEVEVHHEPDPFRAIGAAIAAVQTHGIRLIMKGKVSTPALLQQVLDKSKGLNRGRLCSSCVVCQVPGLDRLLLISDGGLNIAPTLEQKVDITRNAIDVAHALNIEVPKVAILAAIEEVNPHMPATVDAACIAKMADRGAFKKALVDGPLALDNAVSEDAAREKGINSPVAGKADVLIVHSIEVGNALGKSLGWLAGSSNANVVVGARVPVVLPSRAGKAESKWASLALGVLIARKMGEE